MLFYYCLGPRLERKERPAKSSHLLSGLANQEQLWPCPRAQPVLARSLAPPFQGPPFCVVSSIARALIRVVALAMIPVPGPLN